jgi:hypothetical protein
MSDPRILGLTLMAISSGAFLGTTSNSLPPVTFFPALALLRAGCHQVPEVQSRGTQAG